MARTRAVVLLGFALLLGLAGVWLLGARLPGAGSMQSATPLQGGSTALTLDALLEEFQVIPLAGRPAPAFTLDTLDGARFGLADLAGRPALLYFWATW